MYGAREQLGVTAYLREYYMKDSGYREAVRIVIQELRRQGLLNKHGKDAVVGADVKTVTAVLWCAGLKQIFPDLESAMDIYNAMSIFDASE